MEGIHALRLGGVLCVLVVEGMVVLATSSPVVVS